MMLGNGGMPSVKRGVISSKERGPPGHVLGIWCNQPDKACGWKMSSYLSNTLTYANDVPSTFEQTPVVGQPVYVDDSNDLAEGVTLSMSPLNDADVENPLAGHLWYCQDEIADGQVGGARATATFDTALPTEETEQEFCVRLAAGFRELA